MRVRGLKQVYYLGNSLKQGVAPHAGAWIETPWAVSEVLKTSESHPMRVRGLKLMICFSASVFMLSHPMRVRGLKLLYFLVAMSLMLSHPMRVRGLKPPCAVCFYLLAVAPHAGAWIETPTWGKMAF